VGGGGGGSIAFADNIQVQTKQFITFCCSIDTDIEFGNRCNISTILVLTGVSTLADVEAQQQLNDGQERNVKIPEYYIDSMTEFYNLI
jgi:ribonucleotide monophosphatase NagD (HAD superfamily)